MTRTLSWIAGLTLLAAGAALGESRTFDVDPFNAVSVSSGLVAVVTEGTDQSVTAEAANAAILNRLDIAVRDRRLEVGLEWNLLETIFSLGQRQQIIIRITAPRITAVDASAGANVDVTRPENLESLGSSSGASLDARDVAAAALNLSASSGASLTVAGTCERLTADSSTGATIAASDLQCSEVDVNASTGARLTVWASEAVAANASTGATISVLGNPPQSDLESSTGGTTRITQ